MRVLFVASEVAPFRKTGGLADVAGALPVALRRRGVDVRVVMPLYQGIDWNALEPLDGVLEVPSWWGQARAGVRRGRLPGSDVPVYFLAYDRYFDRPHLYGPPGDAYGDNLERFAFLSRGALALTDALGWTPDVVHAHDWQAGLTPHYVDVAPSPVRGAATVLTIHNLAYQGVFDPGARFITGLGPEHAGELDFDGAVNLLKAGLVRATMVTTVSPTYAREIRTPEHGFGLDGLVAARGGDVRGVLNGVDVEVWDPARDPHLPARYDAADLAGKAVCKAALQRELGLPERARTPVIGVIGRLTPQKGFDVLGQALERILARDVQVALLGAGDPESEAFFPWMAARFPDRLAVRVGFHEGLAHRIEAGSDFFLMPSRFEPCGLNQLYSLRYGTLPIVRATGGLVDTVASYDEATGDGTGFVFWDLTPDALVGTVGWALSTWTERPAHIEAMRRRAMARDVSWDRAAAEYEALYREAVSRRRG